MLNIAYSMGLCSQVRGSIRGRPGFHSRLRSLLQQFVLVHLQDMTVRPSGQGDGLEIHWGLCEVRGAKCKVKCKLRV